MDDAGLYRLMTWLSPSYPVGAFSHSHGLEWAVDSGEVPDSDSTARWIGDVLCFGGGWQDAVLFVHAHRAASVPDRERLAGLVELAAVLNPCRERQTETLSQGGAFALATRAAWPAPADSLAGLDMHALAYPVAVAACAADHGLPETTVGAYLHAFAANIVSAAQRLIPLGQSGAQRVIAALEPVVHETAARALVSGMEDIGGSALLADIAAMRHETQYTRLFRT